MPPDVLVLERELFWGGGDGVLAVLREERFRWPEAVIMTTADCRGDSPRTLPPVAAVLRKPFCMAALWEAVRQAQYGETHLAARFLRHVGEVAELERWRCEWGSCFEPPWG